MWTVTQIAINTLLLLACCVGCGIVVVAGFASMCVLWEDIRNRKGD